jgi:hypothetical protein
MSDAEIIASAREAELRALFAALFRNIAALDPNAATNFARGLRDLAEAEAIALGALKEARR